MMGETVGSNLGLVSIAMACGVFSSVWISIFNSGFSVSFAF
jgi:hypothetical protein